MARLAIPIVVAEMGWMAMGIVDTMFVGRVSAEAIGAVGLGTSIFYGVVDIGQWAAAWAWTLWWPAPLARPIARTAGIR